MDQLIMDFLGPVAGIPMAIGALLAWWQRRTLRKAHVVALVVLAAAGLVGFFVVLVAGMGHRMPAPLVMPLLHVTAWMTVFCRRCFYGGVLGVVVGTIPAASPLIPAGNQRFFLKKVMMEVAALSGRRSVAFIR